VILAVRGPVPPPPVLHAIDDALFVDKGPHEPVTPQGEHAFSLMARVQTGLDLPDAAPVLRLDEGTSGVCLIVRDAKSVAAWTEALAREDAVKSFLVLVRGIAREKGTVRSPLTDRGKAHDAVTKYRRLEVIGGHSLLARDGRDLAIHQIRRSHGASSNNPVLGDSRHGHPSRTGNFAEKYLLDRPFVHCERVSVVHPQTGAVIQVESPLPGDLAYVLERLRATRRTPRSRRFRRVFARCPIDATRAPR